jgi:hypothetical protein
VEGLRGLVEALYPPNDLGAPDGVATDLVRRTQGYVARLPPSVRWQIRLLFAAVEVLAPVLAPVGRRLSRRSPAARLRAVAGWRASHLYPLRLLGNAVHAQLQMMYLSHPSVVRFVGEYKPVANPDDAFPMRIQPLPAPPEPEGR